MRRRWVAPWVVLGCLAATTFLSGPPQARPGKDGEAKPAAKVLRLPGQVEPAAQTQMWSRIVGYVQQVNVDLGDRVKKGQVLAALAVPELEADVKQKHALVAQASVELRHAQLLVQEAATTLALATTHVQEAEAEIKQAQGRADDARAAYERVKKLKLRKGPTVGGPGVKEKAREFDAAKAAIEEATTKAQNVKSVRDAALAARASTEVSVKAAEARREVVQAEALRAQGMLEYARLRAPFDGVITKRAVAVGALVGPPGARGQPLFTLTAAPLVRFVVQVPEGEDLTRLRIGTAAIVRAPALPGQQFKGRVTRMGWALDPGKQTLRVEIDLANPTGKLRPGMRGTVDLRPDSAKE